MKNAPSDFQGMCLPATVTSILPALGGTQTTSNERGPGGSAARRILTCIEIARSGSRAGDSKVLIDLVKRHLFIRDATPRRIPPIGDEDVDFAIFCEQLRQLIFDELDLGRWDIEMTSSRSDKIE
jgi:hypothetical protein